MNTQRKWAVLLFGILALGVYVYYASQIIVPKPVQVVAVVEVEKIKFKYGQLISLKHPIDAQAVTLGSSKKGYCGKVIKDGERMRLLQDDVIEVVANTGNSILFILKNHSTGSICNELGQICFSFANDVRRDPTAMNGYHVQIKLSDGRIFQNNDYFRDYFAFNIFRKAFPLKIVLAMLGGDKDVLQSAIDLTPVDRRGKSTYWPFTDVITNYCSQLMPECYYSGVMFFIPTDEVLKNIK